MGVDYDSCACGEVVNDHDGSEHCCFAGEDTDVFCSTECILAFCKCPKHEIARLKQKIAKLNSKLKKQESKYLKRDMELKKDSYCENCDCQGKYDN